jgi:exopolysaccharide biosynthesis polyprenyl glycosylphosphotransferase
MREIKQDVVPPQRPAEASALVAKLAAVDASDAAFAEAAGRWMPERRSRQRDRARPSDQRRVTPRWRGRYTRLLVAVDLVTGLSAAFLAGNAHSLHGRSAPLFAVLAFPAILIAALTLGGVYEHRFLGQGLEEFRRILVAGAFLLAAVSTAAYAADAASVRLLALGGVPLSLVLVMFVHVGARLGLHRMRARGRCQQRVIVIGLERSVAELVRNLRRDPHAGMAMVGACVSQSQSEHIEGVPVLGAPTDALSVLLGNRADTVILTAWSDVSQEDLRRLAWDLEGSGAHLLVAPRIAEVAVPRMHIRTVAGQPLLDVEEPEFTGLRRVAKSALDYGLTTVALVLLAPVMVAVAVAVKLSSRGPVLFRQERVGRHGNTFRMTKFRSMYVDAEARLERLEHLNEHGGGPLFKIKNDPRVTSAGRILRRYSLDELPQLFDVLRGSMSLVGPRPPLPREVEKYEQDVRRRLLVTPGITGLWQVSGRSDLSWEESVRLDLSYVENWSLGLDLSIIARTMVAVLASDGAY